MTFLAGIFGVIGRFAGKLLTTTLGWASSLLFGRVPQSRQIVLALITFGSVVWAALVVGVLLPDVGAFLLAVVPAPEAIDRGWIRLAMLIGALIVPAVVGVATLFVLEPTSRPRGRALAAQVASRLSALSPPSRSRWSSWPSSGSPGSSTIAASAGPTPTSRSSSIPAATTASSPTSSAPSTMPACGRSEARAAARSRSPAGCSAGSPARASGRSFRIDR